MITVEMQRWMTIILQIYIVIYRLFVISMFTLNYKHRGNWEGSKQSPQNNSINTGNSITTRIHVKLTSQKEF
jgi:hypothetical protein